MRREREQHALLLGQDLRHGLVALVGMAPLMRDGVAPLGKLRVQVVKVAERPRGKEGVAQVLDLPLDFALLMGARSSRGSGDTRRICQGGGGSQALPRLQTMHRDAPIRGPVGTGSVDVSADWVGERPDAGEV